MFRTGLLSIIRSLVL